MFTYIGGEKVFGRKAKQIELLQSELDFIQKENEYLRFRIAELPDLLEKVEEMSDSEIWKEAVSECRRLII